MKKHEHTLSTGLNTSVIVVLNDGETYTDISGCRILIVTESGMSALDDGIDPNDLDDNDIVTSIRLETLFGT